MSQQLVALGCCIDSHSHRDFRDVVLRDLAVLPCDADQLGKDTSRVGHPPAAVDEIDTPVDFDVDDAEAFMNQVATEADLAVDVIASKLSTYAISSQ